ncbi:hypothetical protein Pla22_04390 [Rubripirellula amarantea]|uniref:(5-formylfuran-3-yl)methyl phosphate synthase n=1 Tax=Rubripirellula amarantea TaxID=2527999 RepID=A0A5C5WRP4_9BACT|nr:(5-formylfuran-3-yl)methyl phosphate synthase [Rubripirellula amarantea]TWT52811.1 hypothetical protein Pla22_04390 [Rubripirellula amarantea]
MRFSPELLISVQSISEFDALVTTTAESVSPLADIIDLKDPRRGPLAPASSVLWDHAAKVASNRPELRISAALGEYDEARAVAATLPARFDYAKMGPSGLRSVSDLCNAWQSVRRSLPEGVELVGVAYADHTNACTLPADEIFTAAQGEGLRRVLVDTFVKDGISTLEHLGIAGSRNLIASAKRQGLWCAIAGSLAKKDFAAIMPLEPAHCVGVRGSVCEETRTSDLCIQRCQQWRSLVDDWKVEGLAI